jgi:hypothetical protein
MRAKQRAREAQRTVCRHLVALHAVLAGQAGDAGFLVDLGGDGVFRVTEDALEFGVEALALWLCETLSVFHCLRLRRAHTFLGPCGLEELLRLP